MTTLAALPDLEGLTLAVAPASDRAVLRARLLGDLDVRLNGVPVQLGRSAKARGLLAFLIDRGSRPIPRDLLMEVFWPASAPGAARNSLHVALHGVRKVLARAWPGEVIACRGDTYRLSDRIEVWSDVAELDRHSAQARLAAADGRTEEALAECEAALELYRGEFLADDPYLDWALERREELRLRFVACADRLSELYLARGDLPHTVTLCSEVLRQEPCHEPVARRLIVAYARLGQPHMALREYERIVAALARQLGVMAAPETVRLAEGVRDRSPV